MNLKSNAHELLTQVLAGEVWPALGDRHGFRVDPDGRPFLLPGMGGVTLGVHCGDPATGWAGDHIEPGLSVRHRNRSANFALQYLSCVGNRVVIASGPGAGAEGMVIGQHAYVLVDMDDSAMRQVTTGDQVTIFAFGQGMRLPDHREIALKNCSPGLLAALGGDSPRRPARGACGRPGGRRRHRRRLGHGIRVCEHRPHGCLRGAWEDLPRPRGPAHR